jgi:hypothetical protein
MGAIEVKQSYGKVIVAVPIQMVDVANTSA